jgi:hypothetical protein
VQEEIASPRFHEDPQSTPFLMRVSGTETGLAAMTTIHAQELSLGQAKAWANLLSCHLCEMGYIGIIALHGDNRGNGKTGSQTYQHGRR